MGGQKGIALFNSFMSKYVNLYCATTRSNSSVEEINYPLYPIFSNSKLRYINLFYFFTLKKIIKKHSISHIIIEHPYLGWLGVSLKIFCNQKLITHSHNIENLRFKSMGNWWWGILKIYEKAIHRFSDVNFFISDEDKQYALKTFKLKEERCHTITYGFDLSKPPSEEEKSIARKTLNAKYKIPDEHQILLFNGTLDYGPNLEAVNNIIHQINPLLLTSTFEYTIIICGKNLPKSYNDLKDHRNNNIVYAGFVDDITLFFKGADIFINPVIEGGGIKTKLVEALGYNLNCVSTKSGAIGVPANITNSKLTIVENKNWKIFAEAIMNCHQINNNINETFFDHFYWGNIAQKAAIALQNA